VKQARNLCRALAAAPAKPLLVWSGGGHAAKEAAHGWGTMGTGQARAAASGAGGSAGAGAYDDDG